MADYKYMTQDKSNPVSNNNTSFTTTHTEGGFVTKTETTVEYVRVPAVTTQAPAGTILSASQQHPKAGALSNLYWWCKPISTGNNGGFNYGKPNGTGIHNYYKASDPGVQQQIESSKQERTVTRSDGWDKSNNFGKDAQLKGIPLTKPTILVDNARDQSKNTQFIVVPTHGNLQHPVGSIAEILLPSIDSTEAARRYGGFTNSPVEAYVPAIDSREAAYKYRGQEL